MTKVISLNSLHQTKDKIEKSFKDHKFALSQVLSSKEKNIFIQDIMYWFELFSRDKDWNLTAVNLWKIMTLTKAWKFKNLSLAKELLKNLKLPSTASLNLSDWWSNNLKNAA